MRTQRNTTTQIISAIVLFLILLSRRGLDFSRSIRSLILNILARLFGSFGGLVLNSTGVVLLFGFLFLIFGLELRIGIAILRDTVILIMAESKNYVEHRIQKAKTNRETNTFTERNSFLVVGDSTDDESNDQEQIAEQRDTGQKAQHDRNQKQPAVAPVEIELNVIALERDDGCPARLPGFLENLPVCNNFEYKIRHSQKNHRVEHFAQ